MNEINDLIWLIPITGLAIDKAAAYLKMSIKAVRSNVPESYRTSGGHRRWWEEDLEKWKQSKRAKPIEKPKIKRPSWFNEIPE